MKLQSVISILKPLKLHYLEISNADLVSLNDGKEKGIFNQRVIIKISKDIKWQAGIVALGEGKGYITISSQRLKKAGLEAGDSVEFTLSPDKSELGHPIPEEVIEIFRQDPEIKVRFDELKPSMKRYIIYHIIQVKSSEKRIERSLLLFGNLMRFPLEGITFRQILGKEG